MEAPPDPSVSVANPASGNRPDFVQPYFGDRVEVHDLVTNPENDGLRLSIYRIAPGTVFPRHSHDVDYIEFVLDGEVHHGNRVVRRGAGVFRKAGTPYTFHRGAARCGDRRLPCEHLLRNHVARRAGGMARPSGVERRTLNPRSRSPGSVDRRGKGVAVRLGAVFPQAELGPGTPTRSSRSCNGSRTRDRPPPRVRPCARRRRRRPGRTGTAPTSSATRSWSRSCSSPTWRRSCRPGVRDGRARAPQRQTALVAKQVRPSTILAGGKSASASASAGTPSSTRPSGSTSATRAARIEEQIALLRRLWTEPSVEPRRPLRSGVDCRRHRAAAGRAVPIWIGSGTERTRRGTGRAARRRLAPDAPGAAGPGFEAAWRGIAGRPPPRRAAIRMPSGWRVTSGPAPRTSIGCPSRVAALARRRRRCGGRRPAAGRARWPDGHRDLLLRAARLADLTVNSGPDRSPVRRPALRDSGAAAIGRRPGSGGGSVPPVSVADALSRHREDEGLDGFAGAHDAMASSVAANGKRWVRGPRSELLPKRSARRITVT